MNKQYLPQEKLEEYTQNEICRMWSRLPSEKKRSGQFWRVRQPRVKFNNWKSSLSDVHLSNSREGNAHKTQGQTGGNEQHKQPQTRKPREKGKSGSGRCLEERASSADPP